MLYYFFKINTQEMLPNKKELKDIKVALKGWPDDKNILAPCYLPENNEVEAIFNFINKKIPIPEEIMEILTDKKTIAANFQAFIINEPINNSEHFKGQILDFINNLKEEIDLLNKVFEKIGFNDKEIELFHLFVSHTSPIIFNMGFADAIDHASQVTRKCIMEAYKQNSNNLEILMTAMVGWVHDPKVPLKFSWSNLSTHPIIASALAYYVFEIPEFAEKVKTYLNSINSKDPENFKIIVDSIAEALAINNDSEYVLKNGILYRPNWATGPLELGGIIDQILAFSPNDCERIGLKSKPDQLAIEIEEKIINWFENTHHDNRIREFNSEIELILDNTYFSTGIRGIKIEVFEEYICRMSESCSIPEGLNPYIIFEELVNNKITDKTFIDEIRNSINTSNLSQENIFVTTKISGKSLLSHHLGVVNPSIASQALEVSDPLLLSPHKLLIEGVKETIVEQIEDFTLSFVKNITYLPKEAQKGGLIWQRDLYTSVLKAADDLTGNSMFKSFVEECSNCKGFYKPFNNNALQELDISIIEEQIKNLKSLITNPQTWKNPDEDLDFAYIKRKNLFNKKIVRKIYNSLKENYDIATEKSPEMFGLIPIKDV